MHFSSQLSDMFLCVFHSTPVRHYHSVKHTLECHDLHWYPTCSLHPWVYDFWSFSLFLSAPPAIPTPNSLFVQKVCTFTFVQLSCIQSILVSICVLIKFRITIITLRVIILQTCKTKSDKTCSFDTMVLLVHIVWVLYNLRSQKSRSHHFIALVCKVHAFVSPFQNTFWWIFDAVNNEGKTCTLDCSLYLS